MTVLVTGGAGYIGSHIVRALLDHGREVMVLDNLSTGRKELVPCKARLVHGDIGDPVAVKDAIRRHHVTAIVHCAAFIKVEESVQHPERYDEVNHIYTAMLAQTAAHCGVRRFIFSSSAAVYGAPTSMPVSESAALNPVNPYGWSKLGAECEVSRHFPGGHVTFRYFNVAGCDRKGRCGYLLQPDPAPLVRAVLWRARRGESVHVFGTDYPTPDSTAVRDYIHVSDLANAHVAALKYLEDGGTSATLNCGYGHGYSVLEVVEAAERVIGKKLQTVYRPRRPGDPAAVVADTALIRSTLPWKPKFDNLEAMIEHQWKWELAQ